MNSSMYSTVGTKTRRPMRTMPAQSKLEAIRRVHAGESKASVARSIGVPESTLRGWCKNEEKILYLSRQSSPRTDESLGQPQPKKPKLEDQRMQPFDLSTKVNGSRSFSPDVPLDYSSSGPNSPNMARMETWNTPIEASDKESNNTVFARRLEMDLNRPQFRSDINASIAAQWNASMMQQQLSVGTLRAATPANTGKMACNSGGLLAIANQDTARYLPRKSQSVHNYVLNWLKFQHMNQTQTQLAHPAINGVISPSNTVSPTQSSLVLKCYEQALMQPVQSGHKPKTISSPQNHPKPAADENTENMVDSKTRFNKLRNQKGKMLLDNLLFNGNKVKQEPLDDEDGMTLQEGIYHGDQFLAYLESNDIPSVNPTQILELRKFLNKLKSGEDKKACEVRNKRK